METMQQSYPAINPNMHAWKGQEITDFQEEFMQKVNAGISEKWFYNHIKSQSSSLPRIDVLNLLSRYVGYANWNDFVYKHTEKVETPAKPLNPNKYFVIVPIVFIILMLLIYAVFKFMSVKEYHLGFYDSYTKSAIVSDQIEVQLLQDNQSTIHLLSDSSGQCKLKTDQIVVKLVVSAPYYYTDTITRVLKKFDTDEKISMKVNDYALMIHYFSEKKVDDWQKRRASLDTIFDERALIYQVMDDREMLGTELYNKQEFIDKLTFPAGSLKHIQVLDTKMKQGKIMLLRFKIKENPDE